MEKYEGLAMEIIAFENDDVIVTSVLGRIVPARLTENTLFGDFWDTWEDADE